MQWSEERSTSLESEHLNGKYLWPKRYECSEDDSTSFQKATSWKHEFEKG